MLQQPKMIVRPLLAVLAVLLTSSGASAAEVAVKMGPVDVMPSLGLTSSSTSNVYLESSDANSDWVTTVSPGLKLALPIRHFFLEVEGKVDWVSYMDNSSENAVNWNVGAAVGADFPAGLSFALKTAYADRYIARTQEFGPGEDSATGTTSAKVSYKWLDAYRVDVSWNNNSYMFDRSATRERAENTFQGAFFWRFMPRMSALLETGWTGYDYDSNTAQDSDAVSLNVGVTWDVGVRSTGFVKGGFQWKTYEVENEALKIENGEYYTVAIGLNHRFTSRTSLSAELNRLSMESDFPQNPYYLRTGLKLELVQYFSRRVSLKLSAKYGYDDYPHETSYTNAFDPTETDSGKRNDTTLGGGVRIGFDATRWLNLGLTLSTENRDSSFDTFDNTDTRVAFDIAAKF